MVNSNMLCPHCKKHELELSLPDYPWDEEQWICPGCDSTFIFEETNENR